MLISTLMYTKFMDKKHKIIKEWRKMKLVHPSYGSIAKKVGVTKAYVYRIIKLYNNGNKRKTS